MNTSEHLRESVESLEALVAFAAEGFPGDKPNPFGSTSWAEYFGVDTQLDPDEMSEAMREAHDEGILAVEETIEVAIVHGTGGPHTEVVLVLNSDRELIRGVVRGYWGGEVVECRLSDATAEAYAEACGIELSR